MPITWKNINAPDFSSGNALMKAGGESITGGLNSLAKAAKTYGDQQEDQRVDVRNANTQNLVDQINQMKNMDNYNNQADQFSQSALMGQNVDASKIMSAYAGREQGIQAEDTARFNHSEMLLGRAEKPILDQYNALVADNNHAGAQTYYEANKDKVRDWSNALNSGETAQRNDQKHDEAETLKTQTVDAGNIYTDILHAPGTTEGTIENLLQKAFDAKDIPQSIVEQYKATAREQYKAGTALTDVANRQISSLGAGFDQKIVGVNAHYDALLDDNRTRITDDEFDNYKKDSDSFSTQSQAIDYIGARSGESHMLTWDTYTPNYYVTDGVNGAQNAAEAVEIVSEDYQRELEDTGSTAQKGLLAQTGGQIPGFVLKRAFDRTGTDESGQWKVSVFHAALKKEWTNYVNRYGAIQIRDKIDQDRKIALNSLGKEKLQQVSALTNQLRNKQKGAFSNSN